MTTFIEPTDIEVVSALLARDTWGTKLISGGTALVLMMRLGLVSPETLVSIRGIEGLEEIRQDQSAVWLGARATHGAIAGSPAVRSSLPSLALACGMVGNVRVRNVGTIGGNVAEADYASDPPTVLVGLDAVCRVSGPEGSRDLKVSDLVTGFYTTSLAAGEVITGISVPVVAGRSYAYEKFVTRSSEDRPCVGVATMARFDGDELVDLSVVVGAVGPVPQRFDALTATAIGSSLDRSTRARVAADYAQAIDPIDDSRGSAWYRRKVSEVLVRRSLEKVSRR